MGHLRRPLFFVAVALLAAAVLLELGSTALLGKVTVDKDELGTLVGGALNDSDLDDDQREEARRSAMADAPKVQEASGYGVKYMALLDGLLAFAVLLMGLGLIVPEAVHGRVQGVATLIVSVIVLILCIVLILAAIVILLIRFGLFAAAPFGTIGYLAMWGFFDRGGTGVVLGMLLVLKLAFAGFLVAAHPGFLKNKGLVLAILTSLAAVIIVQFLHALVPIFLVNITDVVAGIIVALLAAIWAVFLLIGSVVSVVKAVV